MTRSLFDASKVTGPPKPDAGDGDRAWTVSLLTQRIDEALQGGLPKRIRVVGEVSKPNHRSHWYFTLKDSHSAVDCVMFASDARTSPAEPAHGGRFIASGRVQHYAKQGRTQLYVERLEEAGVGALDARLRKLTDELRAEGYFDDQHKQPLPTFPRRIAVVTSKTGAALQDVLDTLRRRCPNVDVLVVDTRVQGDGAGERIAKLVDALDAQRDTLAIDAMLITRGGGSLEDLWCFNDRALADAIWDCSLPVVCAIGHETDTTVCELVADRRCATPTQAAMALSPDSAALREQIDTARLRLAYAQRTLSSHATSRLVSITTHLHAIDPTVRARTRLHDASTSLVESSEHAFTQRHLRLERLAARLGEHRPESAHAERLHHVERAARRLHRAVRHRAGAEPLESITTRFLDSQRDHFSERLRETDALERELILVSPASVLGRGYSITTRSDSEALVRTPDDAPPGSVLTTRLSTGAVTSRVEGEGTTNAPSPQAPLPPRRRKRRMRDDPDQLGLF